MIIITLNIIFLADIKAEKVDSLIFHLDYQSERPFEFKHRVFLVLKSDNTYKYIDYIGNHDESYADFKNWKKEISNGTWVSKRKNEIIINSRYYRLTKKRLIARKLLKIENKFGRIYKFPLFGKREKYRLVKPESLVL